MASQGAEALSALHLIRATLRILNDKEVLTKEDNSQIFDIAIKNCTVAGPTLHRHNEAATLMGHIRSADFDR